MEKAYRDAEKRALDANVLIIPDELIEPDVNPCLDLDELDAMLICTDGDRERIHRWRNVEAGILSPPSIHTIDTYYDASSSDDDGSTESIVSAQDRGIHSRENDQPSVQSANPYVDIHADSPAGDEPEPRHIDGNTTDETIRLSKPVTSQKSDASTELASTIDGTASPGMEKRKFWGQVQVHDSYSVVNPGIKRQKFDTWVPECARWRARDLPLK